MKVRAGKFVGRVKDVKDDAVKKEKVSHFSSRCHILCVHRFIGIFEVTSRDRFLVMRDTANVYYIKKHPVERYRESSMS